VRTISQSGRFCAVCGTTEGSFLENLCEKCFKKENPLDITVQKKIDVIICPLCQSIKIQSAVVDTWNKEEGLETVMREMVERKILENIYTDLDYHYEFEDDIEESKIMNYGVKEFELRTVIRAKPYEEFSEFEKSYLTRIKMIRTSCDLCVKHKSGYFEAILQIRGENRKLTETEQENIENIIDRIMIRYIDAKMSYIIDPETDSDGFTCKVSTKYLAETLAREIKNATAGKMTVAYELKTKSREGLDVYTNTYLVRLPEYTAGDILEFENKMWIVKQITERQIKLESFDNHEQKKFDRKRVENRGKKLTESVVEREFLFVSSDGKNVVIMALDNYENFDDNLERLPLNKQVGENIIGFIYEDKNYYVA
jgi:nonsense-mediated mRNA decay protein 3